MRTIDGWWESPPPFVQRLVNGRPVKGEKALVFANDEWGTPHTFDDGTTVVGYIITPANVRGMITGEREQGHICPRHGQRITGLAVDPFALEIEGETLLMGNCPNCINERAMDI